MTPRFTFKSGERLKREQHIETLFRTGKAFSVFPLRFIYRSLPRTEDEEFPVRVGVSAAKKKFRHAHDRNYVKRLLREAWRLNKHELYAVIPEGLQWEIFLICATAELPKYAEVESAVIKGIARLKKEIEATEIHA